MSKIAKQSVNNNLKRGNPAWGNKREGTGKSGNPNGRIRKDCSLTSLLKEEIEKIPPGEKYNRNWRQLLVLAWLTGAMKNPVLFKELLDRLEGKVVQPVGGAAGGEPVKVEITVSSEIARTLTEEIARGEGT